MRIVFSYKTRMTDQERIDEINGILAKGISRVTIGDRTMEYDLKALRQERADLLAKTRGVSAYKKVTMKNV